jgi:hypothetical protein
MQVKIVRESMNRMIEAWKEIPDMDEEVCSSDVPPSSQARSSLSGDVAILEVLCLVWGLDCIYSTYN